MNERAYRQVPEFVKQQQSQIENLCRRYGVKQLELFGSAVTPDFDPATSDLDFLVEFDLSLNIGSWLTAYFDFKEGLEALFGRSVDLVSFNAIENPHLREQIESQRSLLYAA
jgi:uncharacterized protein